MEIIKTICSGISPVIWLLIQIGVMVGVFGLAQWMVNRAKRADKNFDESLLYDINDQAEKVVRFLNQTIVDNLKKTNGSLTDAQKEQIHDDAIELLKDIISSDSMVVLLKTFNNDEFKIDQYLSVLIENWVRNENMTEWLPEPIIDESDITDEDDVVETGICCTCNCDNETKTTSSSKRSCSRKKKNDESSDE